MPSLIAHTRAAVQSPLRAFSVTLRSPGQRLAYTALAHSSGDALCDALSLPGLPLPVCASVKPAHSR